MDAEAGVGGVGGRVTIVGVGATSRLCRAMHGPRLMALGWADGIGTWVVDVHAVVMSGPGQPGNVERGGLWGGHEVALWSKGAQLLWCGY